MVTKTQPFFVATARKAEVITSEIFRHRGTGIIRRYHDEKQRQLLIVGILGIILTIILAIVALVLIWRPEPEKEKPKIELNF